MDPIRILVCDDSRDFRDGLRALLATVDTLQLVGEAAGGDEAVVAAGKQQPDVILMDLNMPGVSGVEATRRILTSSPHIGVIALTMIADDDSVFSAMQAGARGYLLKGARKADIVRTVQAVADGDGVFGAGLAQRLVEYFRAAPVRDPGPAFPHLTARETQILDLMAEHLTNPEIARRLGLTDKTVRNNVSNIFAKLHVVDRAQAINAAREAGAT